ncbi:MAG: hypothetical protein H7287_10805 [Thermoleophilia bacterium]|nr:hypothetical protein [Thermoleophilia bacterium]
MAEQLHVRTTIDASIRLWTRDAPTSAPVPAPDAAPPSGHRVARQTVVSGGGSAQFTGCAHVMLVPDPLRAQAQLADLLLAVAGDRPATPPAHSRLLCVLDSLLGLLRTAVVEVRTTRTPNLEPATDAFTAVTPVFTVDADGAIALLPDARGLRLPLQNGPDPAWSLPTLAPGSIPDAPNGSDRDSSTAGSSAAGLASWVAMIPRSTRAGASRLGAHARSRISMWGADYRLSQRGLLLLTLLVPVVVCFLLIVVVQVSAGN